MKRSKIIVGKEKISETVSSRIKNPELVRKKHLLIAKKASKLFIKKGYHQTTMREISKATGMALGNLYDYISKKEDVLCLTFDVYHQYIQERLDDEQALKTDDPKELLRSFIRDSLQNILAFKDEIILMYRESRLLPKKNLEAAMKRELEQIRALEKIIQKGIDQGVFRVQEPFFAASMIFYQLIFQTLRGWTLSGKYSDKEANDLLEEYIVNHFMA
jgi:TetR/AcrR family transcriptional regulator, cholesterol catabolism regulator